MAGAEKDERPLRLNVRWLQRFNLLFFVLLVNGALLGSTLEGSPPFSESLSAASAGSLVSFALVCGVAAYATLEFAKRIGGLRGIIQRRLVFRWVLDRLPEDSGTSLALQDAFAIAFGIRKQHLRAVFDLPTEQLAAQLSIAAESAMVRRIPLLSDVFRRKGSTPGPRAAAEMQASIDSLQIVLTQTWRTSLQSAALWISGFWALLFGSVTQVDYRATHLLAAIFVGGVFSWLVRDVVAVVERLRR